MSNNPPEREGAEVGAGTDGLGVLSTSTRLFSSLVGNLLPHASQKF